MQIIDLKLDIVSVPRNTGFVCQHGILRIITDEGFTGIGEMSDFSHIPKYSIVVDDLLMTLKSQLIGRNPFDLVSINDEFQGLFPETMYYYEKGTFIRSGIDMALYDLIGKILGVNVSELLGGRVKDKIKVCYPIFRSRNMEEVNVNLQALDNKFSEGFDVFRLYAGANPDADEAFLSAARSKYGQKITIKSLDFSHLLDWKKALQITRRLLQYDITLVESPALRNDFKRLRNFRMAIDQPVSEHVGSFRQLHELIRTDAVDVLNIALVFIGGFSAAKKAAGAAEIAGKGCLIGTTQELSVGTVAQSLFGSSLTNLSEISDITGPRLYSDDIVKEPVQYKDGYVILPDRSKPGLGIEIDWNKVEQLRVPGFTWGNEKLSQLQDRTTF